MIFVRNDTENVWKSRNSKKGKQDTDKKYKFKRANNDPQNVTQKTKDRATRTPLKNRCWTQVLRKGRKLSVNSWHFDPICYWVLTARHVSNHCLFRFVVHKSMYNRRQHTPSICVKQKYVGTSLCRQKITRGRLLQYDCVYRRAAGMSRLLKFMNESYKCPSSLYQWVEIIKVWYINRPYFYKYFYAII
jgi:hypothetical protein